MYSQTLLKYTIFLSPYNPAFWVCFFRKLSGTLLFTYSIQSPKRSERTFCAYVYLDSKRSAGQEREMHLPCKHNSQDCGLHLETKAISHV